MVSSTFRKATLDDVAYIADNLRQADREELEACYGSSTDDDIFVILSASFHTSAECWVWEDAYGIPLAVFGIVPSEEYEDAGIIWLLGTERMFDNFKTQLREARRYVKDALERYSSLYNHVHDVNVGSKKFLKACGFEFDEPAPFGKESQLFRMFHAGAPRVCVNGQGWDTLLA